MLSEGKMGQAGRMCLFLDTEVLTTDLSRLRSLVVQGGNTAHAVPAPFQTAPECVKRVSAMMKSMVIALDLCALQNLCAFLIRGQVLLLLSPS